MRVCLRVSPDMSDSLEEHHNTTNLTLPLQRSVEYDAMTTDYTRFLLEDLLPIAEVALAMGGTACH